MEYKIYKSRLKAFTYLFYGSCCGIPVGAILRLPPELKAMIWSKWCWVPAACAAFFAFRGFYNLFDRKPQIILNENRLWVRGLKPASISWDVIIDAHAGVKSIGGRYEFSFISLVLEDDFLEETGLLGSRRAKLSNFFGFEPVTMVFRDVLVDTEELERVINYLTRVEPEERAAEIGRLTRAGPQALARKIKSFRIYSSLD